ncbi:hypothetical protein AQUCO_00400633v1 [Aquilegia coerulea]|uniref:AN1-type domain-containing protein n=1 Tax=Aquilegia coerulea TaxID=218851 RepID=A0A2G5EVY0_AQUCA|nr:hypothetical protein AQUCO_00400633v1 [Aquilegia coerulea]
MAQESWTKETEETDYQTPESQLCVNNCGFFGSSATNNLCSKCYKDLFVKQKQPLKSFSFIPVAENIPSASSAVQLEPAVQVPNKVEETHVLTSEETPPSVVEVRKQQPNRCMACPRKVGLTGFRCRCGGMFCPVHRYSEKHECSYDYRSVGRDAIAKSNPVVKARKIEKI